MQRYERIADHTKELEKIYSQRRKWLYVSSIVYTAIIFAIFGWDYLTQHISSRIWWVLISLSLLVSINWWFWTMKSIRTLVYSMYLEYQLLHELHSEIDELKVVILEYKREEDEYKRNIR